MDSEFNRLYRKLEAFHLRTADPVFFQRIVAAIQSGEADDRWNADLINTVISHGVSGRMPDVSQMAKTVQKYLDKYQ